MSLEKKLEENAVREKDALAVLDAVRKERRALINSCTHSGDVDYIRDSVKGLIPICKICKRAI